MAKLLHIQTSPRGSRSASQAVAEHFIDSYRNTHRGGTVETLNVWQARLPEFDGATINAKYAIVHGQPHSPDQVHAWKAVARLADHFKSADKYIVSLPMWNFGIPYKLKHYIDLLAALQTAKRWNWRRNFDGTEMKFSKPGLKDQQKLI